MEAKWDYSQVVELATKVGLPPLCLEILVKALSYLHREFKYGKARARVDSIKVYGFGDVEYVLSVWIEGKGYFKIETSAPPDEIIETRSGVKIPSWVEDLMRKIFDKKLDNALEALYQKGVIKNYDIDEGEYEAFCGGKDHGIVYIFLEFPDGRRKVKAVAYWADYQNLDVKFSDLGGLLEGYEGYPP